METMKPMKGWYSHQQIELTGTSFYQTVDGKEVEVSSVTNKEPNFNDVIYVGVVVKWIRQGQTVSDLSLKKL
jgi:hypothetical protein